MSASVDAAELEKFGRMADSWWDPEGKFKPLHRMNPVRIGYARDRICAWFRRDPKALRPLEGLRLLDIGCGGGLLAEPFARLGADIVGVDASERNIPVARLHAGRMGLEIDYRHGTAEELAAAGERFDAVLNMEVVEHVADVDAYLSACADLLRPGGLMLVSTLNRNPKSFFMAIVGAEYVMRWLPKGTHDWRKFITPDELKAALERAGLRIDDMAGYVYQPLRDDWRIDRRDLSCNYVVSAFKPERAG